MKTRAEVALIGGGVIGASVPCRLTKRGWKDVVPVERDELTSGSRWHAAGGMPTVNGDPDVSMLQKCPIDPCPEIEAASGQSAGLRVSGGYMLAGTPERMEWLRTTHARGRRLGPETEPVIAEEARAPMPRLDPRHLVGALRNPGDGHADPSGATRRQGAEIRRFTKAGAPAPVLAAAGW